MQEYIRQQLALHPSITQRDALKMCFQAAYGAEHLLTDITKVRGYFLTEFDACTPSDELLAEFIAPEVCRVNLAAWKRLGLPWEWLFNLFVESAAVPMASPCHCEPQRCNCEPQRCHCGLDPQSMFFKYISEWSNYADANRLGLAFSFDETAGQKPQPVHHSQQYRDAEKPAYRVISGVYVRLIPILVALAGMDGGIIAIDGRAASGKSTIAKALKAIIGAEIIHMDDFFLPPELRTPERLAEPGGNIHYERFAQEVLPFIAGPFEYKIFDCNTMTYNGTRKVPPSKWRIVEGSYSQHPKFGNYMNLRVFSDIDPQTQMERIIARNGPQMAKMFADKWIPSEERYFEERYFEERYFEEDYIKGGILPCSCKTIFQLKV